jgi:hypothetical protein
MTGGMVATVEVTGYVSMSDPPGHIELFCKRQKGGKACAKKNGSGRILSTVDLYG